MEAGGGLGEVAGFVEGDGMLVVGVRGCVRGVAPAAGDDARTRGVERKHGAGGDVLQAEPGFIVHGR